MPKNWTLAPCLKQLRKQLDEIDPDRDKVSDGSIGDASHSARTSDHNPDDDGVVCAIDVTNNEVRGISGKKLVKALTDKPDPRIRYLIFNGKITVQGTKLQKWKDYHGANAHRHHVHISVFHDSKLRDSAKKWDLSGLETTPLSEKADVAVVLPQGQHLSSPTGEPVVSASSVAPVPTPYNGIGLQATLVNDTKTVGAGTLLTQIVDHISDLTGLPPIFIRIISVLAIATLVFAGIWLGYRLVTYLVHVYREHDRIKRQTALLLSPPPTTTVSV